MRNANNSKVIKQANKFLVYSTIKSGDSMSVEDIALATKLSRPTILNILNEFFKEEIVEKVGYGESSGGRQPTLYSLNLKKNYAIGIDFEFPPMRLMISDIKGNPIYTRKWVHNSSDQVDKILDEIIRNINESIEESSIEKKDILGIGIGMPGTVNIKTNESVNILRIPGWNKVPINSIIQEQIGLPVCERNDAHLLGLMEQQLIDNESNYIYIAYRTGIGAGIFINGDLYDGEFGNPGFIGFTTWSLQQNGKIVWNKKLEDFCSKASIEQKYYNITGRDISYERIIELSDNGDDNAIDILNEAGCAFGVGIANMVMLFDISHVIIGELKCPESNVFIESIRNTVTELTNGYSISEVKVSCGMLDEYDFARGGCFLITKQFINEPKLKLTTKLIGKKFS